MKYFVKLICLLVATFTAQAVSAQDKPVIVQPGAPGKASRAIEPEESMALAVTGYTEADVRFMQHMIVHHQQAVEMSALIGDRSVHQQIALLGKRIILSQDSEMEMMRNWLQDRGEPVSDPAMDVHKNHQMDPDMAMMTGMLSPNEMTRLAAASGDEFDRLYLEGMIKHHGGALIMVDNLMKDTSNGMDPVLSEFLGAVVADQSGEIMRMRRILAALEE